MEKEVTEYKELGVEDSDSYEYSSGMTQWSISGSEFFPTGPTVEDLPPGHYKVDFDSHRGYFLRKKPIITEEMLKFPAGQFEEIIKDIKKFWDSKSLYQKYKYVYKRGILLYGPPGCGKTTLIQLLSDELIRNHKGVIISISKEIEVEYFEKFCSKIKDIEKNTPIILVIEDIDGLLGENKSYTTSVLLNLLDGGLQLENLVTIATTNHPEDLEERVANRPSRFDRRYEIGIPTDKVKQYYLKAKIKKEDIKKYKIDINEWVKKTKGYTISHLKEIILSVVVLGYSFKEALLRMNSMMEKKTISPTPIKTNGEVGFEVSANGS